MENELEIDLPLPEIKIRDVDIELFRKCENEGLHPVLARIIASRKLLDQITPSDFLFPKLSHLANPNKMADIDKAANRIAKAIINKECIGLETDHDCDGQTSHAIFYYNLVNHFNVSEDNIRSYIGHRLKEGYGLSEALANRILSDSKRPSLLITADNGSTDEPRIKKLSLTGMDVIVTDHHIIPREGYPKSAYACLNPARDDCEYEDKYIAGCMVAWLLMVVVRQKLIDKEYLDKSCPTLKDTLDYVAVGTIADCVSMSKSINNRIVVTNGLALIQQLLKPCWRAVARFVKGSFNSNDLAFRIGPLLNSDGRLSSALGSVSFLLSKTDHEANEWVEILCERNKKRKAIQNIITLQGIKKAHIKVNEGYFSLCIFLENGHAGVHGISASRIKDAYGRPTAFLAPKEVDQTCKNVSDFNSDLVTGSVRGIENKFNVLNALQYVANIDKEMFVTFGGHEGAGGFTIKKESVEEFSFLFEKACREQLDEKDLGPVIFTDGELSKEHLCVDFIDLINKLEPYGRGFEAPIFHSNGVLTNIYPVGDGSHTKFSLKIDGRYYRGIWFNKKFKSEYQRTREQSNYKDNDRCIDTVYPRDNCKENNRDDGSDKNIDNKKDNSKDNVDFNIGDEVIVAFSLVKNCYNGNANCELQILTMKKV